MRSQRPQPLTIDDNSFLPGLSLFTPSTAGQSSYQTPMTSNHCSTILEEDDSDVESTRPTTSAVSWKRSSNSMALCPRVLRVGDDSQSDDEFPEHAVLRFPAPPAAVPKSKFSSKPVQPPPRSHSLRLRTIAEPQQQLKSCFEDDSPTDFLSPKRSSPCSSSPVALIQRDLNALSPSSITSPGSRPEPYFSVYPSRKQYGRAPSPTADKSLPIVPSSSHKPGNISPTPSLTYSDSSATSTGPTTATHSYIPSSSIVPAPPVTSARDVDEYLDTLSAYFPPDVWTWHDDAKIIPASTEILARSQSKSSLKRLGVSSMDHTRNPSTDSIMSDNASDTSYSTCNSYTSSTRLQTSGSVTDLSSKARTIRHPEVTLSAISHQSPLLPRRLNLSEAGSSSRSSSPTSCGSKTPSPPPHQFRPKSILKSSKSTPALRREHRLPHASKAAGLQSPEHTTIYSHYPTRSSSSCGSLRVTATNQSKQGPGGWISRNITPPDLIR